MNRGHVRFGWVGACALLVGLQVARGQEAPLSCQMKHPGLLFKDIAETPGYKLHAQEPWKTWEGGILAGAQSALDRDFSVAWSDGYNRMIYRAGFARSIALAYQITKDAKYAEKAKQALLNTDKGEAPYKMDKALGLMSYCLAYDWTQPFLDAAADSQVRDGLALLADSVYKDLNEAGSNLDYVTFADYHGQAYPVMGVAGLALSDYTKTSGLASTPADWLKAGTEYLFVNDKLHNHNRSLFSFGFDELSGKHLVGAYKSYVVGEFVLLFQVHNYVLSKNLLEEYPAAKRAFTSELWESLPNHFHNNYVTSGNTGWRYHVMLTNLLDDDNKSYTLNHDDKVVASKLLPEATLDDALLDTDVSYCTRGDVSAIPRAYPAWTSHLLKDAPYQVFRQSWQEDSEWLALVTFNADTGSNRDSAHHDQLSFEYFAKGDLLLADAGEHKHILGEVNYSEHEIYHNTIAVEDPRNAFPLADWSNSAARGFVKGWAGGLMMPVEFGALVQVPWMELMETRAQATKVTGKDWADFVALSSPIQYERIVAFPDKDYFAVLDRLEGTEAWTYRHVFRPTSFSVVTSADANKDQKVEESEVGHVKLDLSLGGKAFDWLAQPYKKEIATQVTANSVEWKTTNPAGKAVETQLFSAPASEVLVTRHVGRIGGYDTPSEVFSPVVYLRDGPATNSYRVTVLLSRYAEETKRSAEVLAVKGVGQAIRVVGGGKEDTWYTGTGPSTFGAVATDAESVHYRLASEATTFTLLHGTKMDGAAGPLATASTTLDYLTYRGGAAGVTCKVKTQAAAELRLHGFAASTQYKIVMDAAPFSSFEAESGGSVVRLSVPAGEHLFEITGGGVTVPEAGTGPLDGGAEGGVPGATPGVESGDTGGCGCRAGSAPKSVAVGIALLGIGVLARRKRQQRRNDTPAIPE